MTSAAYPMTPSISMLQDRNMDTNSDRKRKRPPNTGSSLLDNQENYLLFSVLGPENISLSAGVVELLCSDGGRWRKLQRGVISLVKDYFKRAYYMRLYDLLSSQVRWEFKLYKNFQSSMFPVCTHLLTFESENDGTIFGLSFSSSEEARQFKSHLDKRYEQEKKTVAVREPRSTAPASSIFSMGGGSDGPFSNGVTPVGAAVSVPKQEKKPSSSSFFTVKKKKEKKPRIRKEDISNPTNFQHKAHVGWNQDSGFSNNVDNEPMDESIKNIIRAAGKDPSNLSRKTIRFVYDFIERYEENTGSAPDPRLQTTNRQQAPSPPAPTSQPISQWSAPPPPPSRNASYQAGPPSRPPPPPPGGSKLGSRPLPQVPTDTTRPAGVPPPPPPPPPLLTSSSAPPAPPPPPTSLSSTAPPPPPLPTAALPSSHNGRGNLLAEIQAGKQLKSVNSVEKKSTSNADVRDDVMAQIRQGAQLKHVDPAEQANRRSVSALENMGGIAGALAKALEERRNNMQLDDSSDDDDNSEEKNEWSD